MEKTGITIRVLAVGTGQAVRLARNGDADVLLVHHLPSELALVREGIGLQRLPLMTDDYVLIGPKTDPAAVAGSATAAEAFRRVATAEMPFLSRGDDGGTHKKERALWNVAQVDVEAASGRWYRETGSGMSATLNTASALGAYTLADRATWAGFRNKGKLTLLFEGDPTLVNQYAIVPIDPEHHPHIRAVEARTFVVWLTSEEGQAAIADFKPEGQQLYVPNAPKTEP